MIHLVDPFKNIIHTHGLGLSNIHAKYSDTTHSGKITMNIQCLLCKDFFMSAQPVGANAAAGFNLRILKCRLAMCLGKGVC